MMKRADEEFSNGHSRKSFHDEGWNPFESVEKHLHGKVIPDFESSKAAVARWLDAEGRLAIAACASSVESGRRALFVLGISIFCAFFALVFMASLLAVSLVSVLPGNEMRILAISAGVLVVMAIALVFLCRSSLKTFTVELGHVLPKILGEKRNDIQ